MRRYTTPTIGVTIRGADLTGCDVCLTLRQGRTVLEFSTEDFVEVEVGEDSTRVELTLTQEQSAMFDARMPYEVEANVVDSNDFRAATGIKAGRFDRNLKNEVMHHG